MPSDILDRRAQLCNMVHAQGRDPRYNGLTDHIRSVILPTTVCLEYCGIDAFFDEGVKSQ